MHIRTSSALEMLLAIQQVVREQGHGIDNSVLDDIMRRKCKVYGNDIDACKRMLYDQHLIRGVQNNGDAIINLTIDGTIVANSIHTMNHSHTTYPSKIFDYCRNLKDAVMGKR